MRLSDRERTFWRRFDTAAASYADRDPDLFHERDVAERRLHHLTLVIQRKARLLGVGIALGDLSNLEESRLEAIRVAFSQRLALLKRNETLTNGEIAA